MSAQKSIARSELGLSNRLNTSPAGRLTVLNSKPRLLLGQRRCMLSKAESTGFKWPANICTVRTQLISSLCTPLVRRYVYRAWVPWPRSPTRTNAILWSTAHPRSKGGASCHPPCHLHLAVAHHTFRRYGVPQCPTLVITRPEEISLKQSNASAGQLNDDDARLHLVRSFLDQQLVQFELLQDQAGLGLLFV